MIRHAFRRGRTGLSLGRQVLSGGHTVHILQHVHKSTLLHSQPDILKLKAGAAEYSERQGHGMTPSVPSLAWPVWVAYALNS